MKKLLLYALSLIAAVLVTVTFGELIYEDLHGLAVCCATPHAILSLINIFVGWMCIEYLIQTGFIIKFEDSYLKKIAFWTTIFEGATLLTIAWQILTTHQVLIAHVVHLKLLLIVFIIRRLSIEFFQRLKNYLENEYKSGNSKV